MQGLVSVDLKTHQATFRGGTTLKEVNLVLEEHGLALPQLGSISEQTVAGAIATGKIKMRWSVPEQCDRHTCIYT